MRFLVESTPKGMFTSEQMALIPAEMARGQELDAQGVRLMLYVAADQSKAWQVLQGPSMEDVRAIVETLPLHPYSHTTITALA